LTGFGLHRYLPFLWIDAHDFDRLPVETGHDSGARGGGERLFAVDRGAESSILAFEYPGCVTPALVIGEIPTAVGESGPPDPVALDVEVNTVHAVDVFQCG